MLCSDLERYLEAYIDGRLGRSRITILRRHLGLCAPCRARIERLRRFEREIGRQLGSRQEGDHPSLWQGLEVDFARSFSVGGTDLIPLLRPLPPSVPRLRPPSPRAQGRTPRAAGTGSWRNVRRRMQRVAGILAVALALGAIYEFARAWLVPGGEAEAAAQVYLDFVAGRQDLALRTTDASSLQAWLKGELGRSPPTPPVPQGFRLVGGARTELGHHDAAMIVYAAADAADTRPTLLFVQTTTPVTEGDELASTPVPREVAGYNQLAWETEPYSFRLVSAEPAARLQQFAP